MSYLIWILVAISLLLIILASVYYYYNTTTNKNNTNKDDTNKDIDTNSSGLPCVYGDCFYFIE